MITSHLSCWMGFNTKQFPWIILIKTTVDCTERLEISFHFHARVLGLSDSWTRCGSPWVSAILTRRSFAFYLNVHGSTVRGTSWRKFQASTISILEISETKCSRFLRRVLIFDARPQVWILLRRGSTNRNNLVSSFILLQKIYQLERVYVSPAEYKTNNPENWHLILLGCRWNWNPFYAFILFLFNYVWGNTLKPIRFLLLEFSGKRHFMQNKILNFIKYPLEN